MNFPEVRMRRYRKNSGVRDLLSQEIPSPSKFIWPIFIVEGKNIEEEISSMPNQFRYSIDRAIVAVKEVMKQGVNSVLIFGAVSDDQKDPTGTGACAESGVVQEATRKLKEEFPSLLLFTDVCLCAYTDHGHCGPLDTNGSVDNDRAIERLAEIALSHAEAGADCVAPSAMMDGQIAAIRTKLDENGYKNTLIMSYSSKFASNLYGPFRDAENSTPGEGGREGYQAPLDSSWQALREAELDEKEGADMLMVKPALFYLDIVSKIKEASDLPLAVYNVSGEYSMVYAMADKGWGELYPMACESIMSMKRAGADIFISYWANQYNKLFGLEKK